jgi:hypothetical protein
MALDEQVLDRSKLLAGAAIRAARLHLNSGQRPSSPGATFRPETRGRHVVRLDPAEQDARLPVREHPALVRRPGRTPRLVRELAAG